MRLIDADKLMMSLADWWFSSFGEDETEESKAIHAVMDKVEKGMKHFEIAQPHWIPVTERLPKYGQTVLVTSATDKCYAWICHPYGEDDYMWEDDAGYLRDKYDAVAWMPLPEPYKEEQK